MKIYPDFEKQGNKMSAYVRFIHDGEYWLTEVTTNVDSFHKDCYYVQHMATPSDIEVLGIRLYKKDHNQQSEYDRLKILQHFSL